MKAFETEAICVQDSEMIFTQGRFTDKMVRPFKTSSIKSGQAILP